MTIRTMLAAALLAGAGLGAEAGEVTVTFADGGAPVASLAVPDGWVATSGEAFETTGAPRVLGLHPEEDLSLWIGVMAPPEVTEEAEALAYLSALGERLVDEAEVEAASPAELAGLSGTRIAGRGTRQGAPVDFAALTAPLPSGGWIIVLFVGEHGAREAYAQDIADLRASFAVLDGGGR